MCICLASIATSIPSNDGAHAVASKKFMDLCLNSNVLHHVNTMIKYPPEVLNDVLPSYVDEMKKNTIIYDFQFAKSSTKEIKHSTK